MGSASSPRKWHAILWWRRSWTICGRSSTALCWLDNGTISARHPRGDLDQHIERFAEANIVLPQLVRARGPAEAVRRAKSRAAADPDRAAEILAPLVITPSAPPSAPQVVSARPARLVVSDLASPIHRRARTEALKHVDLERNRAVVALWVRMGAARPRWPAALSGLLKPTVGRVLVGQPRHPSHEHPRAGAATWATYFRTRTNRFSKTPSWRTSPLVR